MSELSESFIATIRQGKHPSNLIYLHRNLFGPMHENSKSCPCEPFIFYVGDKRSNKEIATAAVMWFGLAPGETQN